MMEMLIVLIFFVLGLIAGSFANVCIVRIPEGESIVFPPSHCPRCSVPLPWYDNIPLLSYLLLKARCRSCSGAISARYPFVELLTGVAFALVALHTGMQAIVSFLLVFTFALIVITFIDLQWQVIPDSFSLGLIIAGLSGAVWNSALGVTGTERLFNSALGAATGFCLLWGIAVAGRMVFKQDAMGEGDVRLMAGIGAFLGWQGVFSVLLMASLMGAVAGLILIKVGRLGRRSYIPFGPFLAAAAFVQIFFPPLLSVLNQAVYCAFF